jgi:hypothetical protein
MGQVYHLPYITAESNPAISPPSHSCSKHVINVFYIKYTYMCAKMSLSLPLEFTARVCCSLSRNCQNLNLQIEKYKIHDFNIHKKSSSSDISVNSKKSLKLSLATSQGLCIFKGLFHYHEDGSKKLNACNQLFLCMIYF